MITYLLGGGDLASGVAMRLHRAGMRLVIFELPQPLVVRRLVSFANAIFEGYTQVEEIKASHVLNADQARDALDQGYIPVVVDPHGHIWESLLASLNIQRPQVLVDGRMTKQAPDIDISVADLVIGLGPGFEAGKNCHAVIETNRGHTLGRVIWEGKPLADTGVPESIANQEQDRVLRAPADGPLIAYAEIGQRLSEGQLIAEVASQFVNAPFTGVLRGLIYPGVEVTKGLKIGDLDPRDDPSFSRTVSDKALAIGGGVIEAILADPELRRQLWV